jgi:Tfp pilus assembly protein PilV
MAVNNARGITLVEGLVTLVILLVGIMGLMTAYTATLKNATLTRNDSQALYLASAFVEELRAKNFSEWAGGDPGPARVNLNDLAANFNANFQGQMTDGGAGFYTITAFAERVDVSFDNYYYDITVMVSWEGDDDQQEQFGMGSQRQVEGVQEAFVLETSVIDAMSDDIYGEETEISIIN